MTIAVVLGSTRPGRIGDRVCRFVMHKAALVGRAEFVVVDLADHPMPFFNEPVAPLSNRDRQVSPVVRRWLHAMATADGYVFLTPEYNHAPPAVLKNALDFLTTEVQGKPAAILSYSTTAHGGILAGQQLRLALSKAGITGEAVAETDAAHLDEGPAAAALLRLLDASWRTLQRYPQLLSIAATAVDVEADHTRHQPVVDHLDRLLTRGRQSGEFTDDVPTPWLATAVVTLGHAAGDAVNAGRMTPQDATEALARSVLRVCGVDPATITDLVSGAESRT